MADRTYETAYNPERIMPFVSNAKASVAVLIIPKPIEIKTTANHPNDCAVMK